MRISISGTYSVGKTSTVMALSHFVGIPRTTAKAIREIMPTAVPGKRLAEVTPAEFLQLMMERHCGRVVAEDRLGESFLSDGSSLQEWAYGKVRVEFGMNPTDATLPNNVNFLGREFFNDVVDRYEVSFKNHVADTFDSFIHLKNERPITNDGHRPMNEEFRRRCDELLIESVQTLNKPVVVIGGTMEERLETIADTLGLTPVVPVSTAIEEMRKEYARQDLRLETER